MFEYDNLSGFTLFDYGMTNPEADSIEESSAQLPRPGFNGAGFEINPVYPLQQRERILIAAKPASSYLHLTRYSTPPDTLLVNVGLFVSTDHGVECVDPQYFVCNWLAGSLSLELRVKTPATASKEFDSTHMSQDSGYFLEVELMQRIGRNYCPTDSLTTNLFRTVTHSKQTTNRRRSDCSPRRKKNNNRPLEKDPSWK